MVRRTELPWPSISRQVMKAITDCNGGKRFVVSIKIAEYIHANTDKYPRFAPCTYRTTLQRVTEVMKRAGWVWYSGKTSGSAVFIDRRVKEQPPLL